MEHILDEKSSASRTNMLSTRSNFIVNTLFWLYSLTVIFPMILVVSISFSTENDVLINGYKFIPENFSAYAYEFLFIDWMQLVRSYGVSIFVTVIGTCIALIMMSLYAYPISRNDFPHRSFFSFFVFFTMLFNGGLVPFYLVYVNLLHLKDSIWALIIPLLVSAFFILILRTFFRTIPIELVEAAKIDGASEFKIFFGIILPLSLPVMASVALFMTVNYWNEYFLSLVFITDNKTVSVQYLLYRTLANIQFLATNSTAASEINKAGGIVAMPSETIRMAMAVIGIGPIVFAYPFFQRYFVKGLTVGAVKG